MGQKHQNKGSWKTCLFWYYRLFHARTVSVGKGEKAVISRQESFSTILSRSYIVFTLESPFKQQKISPCTQKVLTRPKSEIITPYYIIYMAWLYDWRPEVTKFFMSVGHRAGNRPSSSENQLFGQKILRISLLSIVLPLMPFLTKKKGRFHNFCNIG